MIEASAVLPVLSSDFLPLIYSRIFPISNAFMRSISEWNLKRSVTSITKPIKKYHRVLRMSNILQRCNTFRILYPAFSIQCRNPLPDRLLGRPGHIINQSGYKIEVALLFSIGDFGTRLIFPVNLIGIPEENG